MVMGVHANDFQQVNYLLQVALLSQIGRAMLRVCQFNSTKR